jgi:predicted nucleic acid-binding protein
MYLLDTNVVSEMRKVHSGKADERFSKWARSTNLSELYLSAITIQELEIGVLLKENKDYAAGLILRTWLDNHVKPAFNGRVLSVDSSVAIQSALLHVSNPRPFRDGLIAATAIVHGMNIVTRNINDFESSHIKLINPWDFSK